jgi:hypothetical protein
MGRRKDLTGDELVGSTEGSFQKHAGGKVFENEKVYIGFRAREKIKCDLIFSRALSISPVQFSLQVLPGQYHCN